MAQNYQGSRGRLVVLVVDCAVEVALVDQILDGGPDLRIGHALRPHRADAVGDGAADVRLGVAREVLHDRLLRRSHAVGSEAGLRGEASTALRRHAARHAARNAHRRAGHARARRRCASLLRLSRHAGDYVAAVLQAGQGVARRVTHGCLAHGVLRAFGSPRCPWCYASACVRPQ